MVAKSRMVPEAEVQMPVGVMDIGPVFNPAHPVVPGFSRRVVPRLLVFIC